MPEFSNLPGISVQKADGNLAVIEAIPGNVTLIIGTSPSGPIGQVYVVRETSDAEALFDNNGDKTGDLLKGMYEALEAGAQYIALYRIGASPEVIDFLNGWTIQTLTSDSGLYKLAYTFTSATKTHSLKIYNASDLLVYDNSISAPVNTGAVIVSFDESKVTAIADINIAKGAFNTVFTNTYTVAPDSTGSVTKANFTVASTGIGAKVKAGQAVTLSVSNPGTYVVSYATTDAIVLSHKIDTTSGAITALVAADLTDSTGNTTVIKATARLIPPIIGTSLTNIQRYEALAKAYWELEGAKVDQVIPMGVNLNSPNIVNNEGTLTETGIVDQLGKVYQFELNGDLFFLWKTDSTSSVVKAGIVPTPYATGVDGASAKALVTGTCNLTGILSGDSTSASNLLVAGSYSEVNFGHQLAEYLHGLSTNDNEAIGFVSMAGPKNYSKKAIFTWVGKDPIKDSTGKITTAGTGVLGYKYMAGSATVSKGFFHTSSGFPDGTQVPDANNNPIDIGKYLSVTAMPLVYKTSYLSSQSGYVAGAATGYAGLVMSLPENNAPTNKKFKSRVALPFSLPKEQLNSLVGSSYVVFTNSTDGLVKVVDAPTAALPTSDWNRLMTVRCAWRCIEELKAIAEPFIGNLFNGSLRNALEEQSNTLIQKLQKLGFCEVGSLVEVRATRDQEIKGEAKMKVVLVAPAELRQITMYVALSK